MLSLKKKENEFFVYLKDFALEASKVAIYFDDLIQNYHNVDVIEKTTMLKQYETECDRLTQKIFLAINESFVTPFDREDLHRIVKLLDDIVDDIESISARFIMFDVDDLMDECLVLSKLIVEATSELAILFEHLSEIKKNNIVKVQIEAINRIENQGDVIYREAITRLFKQVNDPIEIIKWKHILEKMEATLDSCEAVANMTEGVIMKYV